MSHTTPHHTQTTPKKPSIIDYLDEGHLTDWLAEHGKNILYGLAGLLAFIIIVYAVSSGQSSKAEQEYIQAANDFTFFSKATETQDPILVKDSLDRLKNLMAKHPELHAAYDGSLAQTFLNRSLPSDAEPYALATLARVKSNDLPFYNQYAATTLLISQQDFKKALERAQALQQNMSEVIATQSSTRSFSDELFALNLLRIGILQEATGDHAAELKTWQEWKQYAGLNTAKTDLKVSPQAFRAIMQQLAIGAISLPDYMAYRESLLKK